MRTLTDVFAPGTPTLPEGLRTLVVSPERELEPGMTVRATFTFRNQGGAPATGVRVRFNLPEGLVYLVGSGKLDEEDLDDEQGSSPLLARAGAQIGDVAPGEERRLDISYSVAGAIENGSTVELQAAVAAFELPPVGSNVVRLVAHSRPALENALTNIAIETRHGGAAGASPGGEGNITVRVHNAGESSAHDVVVVAPIPEHTSYVPNSARVNGREFERELLASFDRVHAPIVAASLPASATVTLQYRVRIDDPLPDGTTILARAQIASQETAAFAIEPAGLTVRAQADFEDDRTSVTVEPEYDVTPGSHIRVRAVAFNAGTTAAEAVRLTLDLPDLVLPVRGSFRIDGQPLRERKKESTTYDLGSIGARESVEFIAEAAVLSPIADGKSIPIRAKLQWDSAGERDFECAAVVRSQPRFSSRHNRIARVGGTVVQPSDECEAAITVTNDGSAAATDARLHLVLDPALDEVRVFDKNTRLQMDRDEVDLGKIDPYASRRITVRARVRTPYANRSEIRLGASLHAREVGEVILGEANWRVESHPSFSPETSQLQLLQDDVFRPNQLVEVQVSLRNEGTDIANNVRLRLYVSPEARLESVEGATRERSALLFGEVRPGGTVEAKLGIRLLRSLAKAYPVTIESVLTADAMLPVQLAGITIVTTAEPNFSVGTLHSEPADVADAGDEVEYVLHVRNSGDGPARRVRISIESLNELIYVPNSTRVNELPVRDVGAQSPLTSELGIMLSDVDPGVEATIAWREVVHNGLQTGETIVRVAHVAYDGDRLDDIAADELKVRCSPVFANAIAGLPFGLDGMLGPAFGGGQRALPDVDDRFVQLPPAMPVGRGEGAAISVLSLSTGNGQSHGDEASMIVETVVAFDRDRLSRTLKFLTEARFGGLASHLFALRAFFPDEAGISAAEPLKEVRDILREMLDRLFIKLRLPHYVIAPRDLENAATRASVVTLLSSVQPGQVTLTNGAAVLRGASDAGELRALADRLEDAPLATALPWGALARLLPSESDAEANYRRMLVTSLDDLAGVDETAFVDALQRRPYPVLDAALDVVRAQLSTRA
ncbi:MAG TPA: hypothetical protein VFO29_11345 [Candidatus Rubrimentiphilum sp.]|nr:hypothetical protein [Candidatus Rubrimentiphilum sp.]